MTYLLLILFPLAMAGGSFVLRRSTQLVGWAGVAAFAVELALAVATPIEQPARLLDIGINYTQLGRLFLTVLCGGGLVAALSVAVLPQGEYFVATTLLIMSMTAAILIVQEPFVVAALLLLASLLGGIQLVDQPVDSPRLIRPQTIGMTLKYTLLVALGGLLLLLGFVVATAYQGRLATDGPTLTRAVFGLLLVGFSIRAALIPFHLWLPDLADESPPPTLFVQGGWLTVLAFPVLLVALQTQPSLLAGNINGQRLLLGVGVCSTIGGGLLALTTQRTRRAVAWLMISNLGLLTIGLGITTVAGVGAGLLGLLNHVAACALISLGLLLLELPVPGRREQAGAMRERPLAAVALLVGVLVLVGVPPFSGFVPKLMLLTATQDQGWLIGLLVGSGFVVSALGAARLLQRVLLDPPAPPATRSLISDDLDRLTTVDVAYAPWILRGLILILSMLSLVAGVWPQPIIRQLDSAVRALTFLSQ